MTMTYARRAQQPQSERVKRLIAAYQAGHRVKDIARDEGITPDFVSKAIESAGIPPRRSGYATQEDRARIGCERLLRRQLETGAYWGISPAQARARLIALDASAGRGKRERVA